MNRFSIIIPTYLRQEIIINTLNSLRKQSCKEFEVIIVDQTNCVDNRLKNYKFENNNYHYVHINVIGLPNARNVGAKQACGDTLIFLDDDTIPDENLVLNYKKILDLLGENIVIGGRVIEKGTNIFKERKNISGGWITWYGKTLKNFDTDNAGYCEWAPGGNLAFSKKLFMKVGGFDKNFIGTAVLEDSDFGYSINKFGGMVYYDPKPVVQHLRIPTGGLRQENTAKSMFYRSHNTVYFFRKHGIYRNLLFVFIYLNAVALKDLFKKKHGILAFYWTWIGFIQGFKK